MTAREVSTLYRPLRRYRNLSDLFEDLVQAFYSAHVRPGDLCVDGGANRGRHSILVAQLVGHGKVHSYEPLPEIVELLIHNLSEAHVRQRVEIHTCALADVGGARDFVSFYSPSNHVSDYYSGLRKKATPEDWAWQTIRTPVTTLDCSLSGLSGLSFIKLGLKGGEYHALSGGEQIIKSQRPLIVFENGRHRAAALYGYSVDDFWDLLERLGYALADILGTEMTPELWKQADWNLGILLRSLENWVVPTG